MPRSIILRSTYFGRFFDTVLILLQPIDLKAYLFVFVLLSERRDRYNDPKNTKATIPCLKKGIKRQASLLLAHAVQVRG